ncbi:MAG: GIY-YIG nuclease family protein [bacterium]|nr:GIY-YIG nuclease family protein [bacterium]
MRHYYVYILTNKTNKVLYTGVTNHILRRGWEHRSKLIPGFTQKYNVDKLIYIEVFDSPIEAIKREKQIKAGSRKKKLELVRSSNPAMRDLYDEIFP